MNFGEAVEFLRAFSQLRAKSALSWARLEIVMDNTETKDYELSIREGAVEPEYLDSLEKFVEDRQYKIRKSSGRLFIQSS
jgi:hypothetical protein